MLTTFSIVFCSIITIFLQLASDSAFAFILPRAKLLRTVSMMSTVSTSNGAGRKNIVVIGGGIQGSAVAYYLANNDRNTPINITILESEEIASAASGKGGGFMARSWGDGSPTQQLHQLSFDLFESLAKTLPIASYRKLPVLSVPSGNLPISKNKKPKHIPTWLSGSTGPNISILGNGDDTAQVTPREVTQKFVKASGAHVCYGTAIGIATSPCPSDSVNPEQRQQVTGVIYKPRALENGEPQTLECDTVVICAGPWSCIAEEWFPGVQLPMQGIKSTSIVWKADEKAVDATALFCGEDPQFQTHLEVYPRPDNSIYICGIGGSDYVETHELKAGAFRNQQSCLANPSRVEAAILAFTKMSPGYKGKPLETVQACMRPCPPDALPYMGIVPGYDGVFMNAGHNCWGIAWSAGCGKAMAELILQGTCTCVNLAPFDPARFSPKLSSSLGRRGRKKGTLNVGEQW